MLKGLRFTLLDMVIIIFFGLIATVNVQEANSSGLHVNLIAKSKSKLTCNLLINKLSDSKYNKIDTGYTSGFFYRAVRFNMENHTVLLSERDLNNLLFSFETDETNEIYLYKLEFYKNGHKLSSIPAEDIFDRIMLDDAKNKSLRNDTVYISNETGFELSIQMSNVTRAYNFYEANAQSELITAIVFMIPALLMVIFLPLRFKKILAVILTILFMAYMESYYIVFNYKLINIIILTAICGAMFFMGYEISYSIKTPKLFFGACAYFIAMIMHQHNLGENYDIFLKLFLVSLFPVLDAVLFKIKRVFELSFIVSVLIIFLVIFNYALPVLLPLTLLPFYCLGRKVRGVRISFTKQENRYLPAVFLAFSGLFAFVFSALPSFTQDSLLDTRIFLGIVDSLNINIYIPFLYIVFSASALSCFAMIFTMVKKRRNITEYFYEIDFSHATDKANDYIFILFFVIFVIYLSNWFVLEKMVNNFYFGMTSVSGILNFYLLTAIFFPLYSLFGKKISTVLISIVIVVVMTANFIKLHYLKEPFYPWEIYLIKEAFVIAKNYIGIIFYILTAVLALAAIVFLCKKFIATLRLIGESFSLLNTALSMVLISLIFGNFFDKEFLRSVELTNIEMNWKVDFEEFKENGLFFQTSLYLKNIGNYVFAKPANYSAQSMQEIRDSLTYANFSNSKNKNIIIIMNESFFDLTQIETLTFNEDITRTYRENKKVDIVSPNFGGGTANVEFELLTGFSNYFFSNVMAYSSYIKRQTPSIVSAFRDAGYDTIAIHPFHANFYRRDLVYDYLGFDEFIDITKMTYKSTKGEFISDESVVDEIISLMNKDDSKKFIFAVTMQNHGSYSPERYYNQAPLFTTNLLTPGEAAELNTYAVGVQDSDLSFKKLIDAVNDSKQPTIIYFFGDHLPSLYNTFRKLGQINSNPVSMYQNDLAIYSNYKEIQPIADMVTPNQMALKILRDSGIDYPVYFNILDELYESYPVLQNKVTHTDSSDEILKKYRMIQYDLLIGNKYILKEELP